MKKFVIGFKNILTKSLNRNKICKMILMMILKLFIIFQKIKTLLIKINLDKIYCSDESPVYR